MKRSSNQMSTPSHAPLPLPLHLPRAMVPQEMAPRPPPLWQEEPAVYKKVTEGSSHRSNALPGGPQFSSVEGCYLVCPDPFHAQCGSENSASNFRACWAKLRWPRHGEIVKTYVPGGSSPSSDIYPLERFYRPPIPPTATDGGSTSRGCPLRAGALGISIPDDGFPPRLDPVSESVGQRSLQVFGGPGGGDQEVERRYKLGGKKA